MKIRQTPRLFYSVSKPASLAYLVLFVRGQAKRGGMRRCSSLRISAYENTPDAKAVLQRVAVVRLASLALFIRGQAKTAAGFFKAPSGRELREAVREPA